LFVNCTSAVTPAGGVAESASLIAWSSGFGGGVGPPPAAAAAIAAPPAASAQTATMTMIRLLVDARRR